MPDIFAQLADEKLKRELGEATAAAAAAMDELTAWLESQRATATDDFALGAPKFLEMLRETERVDIPLEELELVGRKDLERNLAALKEACGSLRAQGQPHGLRRKDARQQAFGRHRRGRSRATRGAAAVRHRQEDRHDPEPGAGAGRRIAALQSRQLCVHQHSGSLRRPGGEGHVLRRAARCEVERGGTQRLSSRQGIPALRLGARGVARTLPPIAVHQRQPVARRSLVVGLRLRRGMGALHRRDDVRRRALAQDSQRCGSAC